MLSGVGPKAELDKYCITVMQDLPGVGQNLQDQPTFGLSTEVQLATAVSNASSDAALNLWNTGRSGPLTSSNVDAVGFAHFSHTVRSSLKSETLAAIDKSYPSDWPDFEQFGTAAFAGNQTGFALPPDPTKNYASINYIMMKTFSRGNITLASSSPFDAPRIFPNWLDHPFDRDLALAIFKVARSVLHSNAFKPLLANADTPEVFPGPTVSTDNQIMDWIGENAAHVWHASGTCKMGKPGDEMAVVDSKARVIGFQKLRVVDASVFPFLTPGHPQATVYALAEKIAVDILASRCFQAS
jgi:choline dehydrogenase